MGLDKRFLIEQLAARLRQSDEVARRAGAEAREAARSLQTESEKKEDGRAAIEYGSLATGQTARSRKVQEELQQLAAFFNRGLPSFGRTSPVGLGAIVDVAVESERAEFVHTGHRSSPRLAVPAASKGGGCPQKASRGSSK